jgi:hypothetical protein
VQQRIGHDFLGQRLLLETVHEECIDAAGELLVQRAKRRLIAGLHAPQQRVDLRRVEFSHPRSPTEWRWLGFAFMRASGPSVGA